jgi:hypothetical protein
VTSLLRPSAIFAKRLREAGFSDPQAEAVVATVQDASKGADLATKFDRSRIRGELNAELSELRAELKAEIAAIRAERSRCASRPGSKPLSPIF